MHTNSTPIAPPESRRVERLVAGKAVTDGAGVKLTRVLTAELQTRLDPFLMLDEFRSDSPGDYIAGFPDHPHRGFETITYLLAGQMRHRDNAGHQGLLGPGGVQWMRAGRGIVHSEMPEQRDGLLHGFQLWLNLPARRKLSEPVYRDIAAEEIPQDETDAGAVVKVIAGDSRGVSGPLQCPDTEPLILDIALPAGAVHRQNLPPQYNGFLFVHSGEVFAGPDDQRVPARTLAVLTNGPRAVALRAEQEARLLLIAGRPLGEPIAQGGPFVMNTRAEVEQAFADYRNGRF
ncbi:pirin family protein [Methylogaea oryzae]|uniref:Quercetin 2,3-dioxygenase n=1 Tax=Methylogaea oryzae TaxID=1295382 RepID=A0A8D4VRV9_9GAMM|nr:pirin family protein [Methylogaea oryzae]BBL72592.1 hypothetical protein MoryE10_31980 [Methylogaea oryzae]